LDLFRLASMQQKNICCSTIALLLRVGVDVWESLQRQLRSLNDKMAAEMSVAFGIHWNIQKMVPGAESLVLTVFKVTVTVALLKFYVKITYVVPSHT
jgi:hypothetical protein